MSVRRRFPNPILATLHPGVLPGGVRHILLVGDPSKAGGDLLPTLRRGFPTAVIRLLAPVPTPAPAGLAEVWPGSLADPEVITRARAGAFDLVIPLEAYGSMGETRPDLERFALKISARAVAVYETTYGMVRIATRSHLRYRLYFRPWACRAFGLATLVLVVTPLYLMYMLARSVGLWRGSQAPEGGK